MFANWTIGSLGLVDYEAHHKKIMEGENIPDIIKKLVDYLTYNYKN